MGTITIKGGIEPPQDIPGLHTVDVHVIVVVQSYSKVLLDTHLENQEWIHDAE